MIITESEARQIALANEIAVAIGSNSLYVYTCRPADTVSILLRLAQQKIVTYSPMQVIKKRQNRHSKKKVDAKSIFFPSYIFASSPTIASNERFSGVLRPMRFGELYAEVELQELVRFHTEEIPAARLPTDIHKGDEVRIKTGMLADYHGIILDIRREVATVEVEGALSLRIIDLPLYCLAKE